MTSGIELATAYVSLVADTGKLAKSVNAAFDDAERASARSGRKIGQNLNTSIGQGLGGSKGAAAKAGADAAREYERSLQASIRGEKIGAAIGKPIGKGIGLAIKGGIGVAAAGATAAVALLTTSLTKGFSRLKNIDAAEFKLQALGNSAADVKKIMEAANKSVKGTAFGLDEAAGTASTAVAAGVSKGDLAGYLTNVADAAAIAQSSMGEMGSIFNKVQTNGKAMTDDLQMLADRGLPIFTWLQKQYGVTGEALQKMVEDGKVSAADFNRAISTNIGGAAQKMGQSFDGAVANVQAALGRLGADLISAALGGGGLSGPTDGINNMTEALDKLDAAVKSHQGDITNFFGALVDGSTGAVRMFLNFAAETVGAIAAIYNAIADTIGAVYAAAAGVNHLMGRNDLAEENTKIAESYFGAADGLYKVKDGLKDAAENVDNFGNKFRDRMTEAAEKAEATSELVKDVGTSVEAIPGTRDIRLTSNTPEVIEKLDTTKYKLENLPDGTVKLVPLTAEAQAKVDEFINRNDPTAPARTPVAVDTVQASADLKAWVDNAPKELRVILQLSGVNGNPITTSGNPLTSGLPGEVAGLPAPGSGYVPYNPAAKPKPAPGPLPGSLEQFIPRRARGGPIFGNGPKGKDSVPIMAAPGEHMLTAREVDMLGGQGGAYALRAAIRAGVLPQFSRGGGIKQGVVIFPREPIGRRGEGQGGVPSPKPGPDKSNPRPSPDWSIPGQDWGAPPDLWWQTKPGREDILMPEWMPPGLRDLWEQEWWKQKIGLLGYENGGAIGAIDYAYNQAGKKYQYGTFDCSMLASQVYARMSGRPPGRYFATDSDFASLGFKRGYKPGALNIGTNGGSGTNGHMAVTLPNGVNAENSGSGGSMYGNGAKGANDFSQQWYYEAPNSGDMGDMQTQSMNAHGMNGGAPPGPVGADGKPVDAASGASSASSGRTEGYIPAGAGNTSVAGTSFMSGIYGMGAEVINGVIDQAASVASSAVAAGMAAGTMGAGAAGAPAAAGAAQAAIGMGTQAAKRGVEYGAQMLGIGTDALVEQLTPFGAPRWLSTDPTAFMPQGLSPAATTTSEQLDPNQAPEPPAPPQANLQAPNPEELQPATQGLTINGGINGMDPTQVGDELLKYQRLNALQYQGRP